MTRPIDKLSPLNFLDINIKDKIECDYLVVGTGISGLKTSLSLAKENDVLVITKSKLIETNTRYAQGGIAAVFSDDDDYDLHVKDTIYAGAGLCNEDSVKTLVEEGPRRIRELLDINTKFDRKSDGSLSLTKEAAHSKNRILHAGDTTGAEVERALADEKRKKQNIKLKEYFFLIDILDKNSALAYDEKNEIYVQVFFQSIIFATGSIGQIYKNTSNPEVATGDGLAITYRHNVELSDLEFIQFHPTTFYKKGVPSFLISEALRGEGGKLRNIHGEEFMENYTSKKELAPRDVVSRSILREIKRTDSKCVYLDMTHLDKEYLKNRFPGIYEFCSEHGIDIAKDYIPVSPAAHYIMGGINTDLNGKTNKENIYAVGEVARTGVHGANRLASNSLLEGLVFGKRVSKKILESENTKINKNKYEFSENTKDIITHKKIIEIRRKLQKNMWDNVGVFREEKHLKKALKKIKSYADEVINYKFNKDVIIQGLELINMITVAYLITEAALYRRESRGAHFRFDYQKKREKFKKPIIIRKDDDKEKKIL
ncbi:MAG: L-aspartate oxidase [Fusobacteriota bacterium]